MSINWHTKSQGPKKKCAHFSRGSGRINSCPAGTARNQGSFTSMALWSVQSFLSSTVSLISGTDKPRINETPSLYHHKDAFGVLLNK